MVFNLILFALCAVVGFFQYIQGFFKRNHFDHTRGNRGSRCHWLSRNRRSIHSRQNAGTGTGDFDGCSFCRHLHCASAVVDVLVPGNVRFPLPWISGCRRDGFARRANFHGRLAIAAQSLPFGVTVGGFSRYDVHDYAGTFSPPTEGHWILNCMMFWTRIILIILRMMTIISGFTRMIWHWGWHQWSVPARWPETARCCPFIPIISWSCLVGGLEFKSVPSMSWKIRRRPMVRKALYKLPRRIRRMKSPRWMECLPKRGRVKMI